MKTLTKISYIASFCVLGLGAHAQFLNDFYHIGGFPADHGNGDKVITKAVSEVDPIPAYLVAGATEASSLGNMPSVSLSQYDATGNPVWHQTFLINTPGANNVTAVSGLTQILDPTAPGYAVLAYTNASPQQSVVIRTDASGMLMWKTEVGSNQAAAITYDADLNRILVLTRFLSGTSADLQLISIDAKSGAVVFTRNFDGMSKSDDEPAAIVYDRDSKSYLLVGTSTIHSIIGNEVQIQLTRTTAGGGLIYTRTLGFFGVLETAVDAVLIPNGANSQIAVAGLITGTLNATFYNKQPAYTTVDVSTGSLAVVHVLRKKFDLTSITYIPSASSLNLVGNAPTLPVGTQANLFSVDPTDPSMLGLIHIYNNPFTTFAFHNIREGMDGNLVAVGSHRFPLPWAGSPANETYNWLITADSEGNGQCDAADTLSSFAFQVPTEYNNASSSTFLHELVKIEPIAQTEDVLNGCDLPFRLPSQPSNAEVRFYPNPASDMINIEYSVNENDNVVLNIMDMTGRIIMSEKLLSGDHMLSNFSVANISSGVYYSDLRVNDQSVKKDKLVVQH